MNQLPVVLLSLLTFALCGCGGREERLTGGGSSMVNIMMTRWASEYYRTRGIQIDYTSSGSANGIQQMADQKNDFGCTDAPMTEEQLARARNIGGEVLHIPIVMGGVVPAYNLKEADKPLRLTGPVLADIFLGKIIKWNDSRLKQLNPDVNLPGLDIAVVHRSDGSGTSFTWVDYLAKVSPEWKEQVGVGTSVRWPVGIGMQKNDGVANQISRTPGSIGYLELAYALRSNIPYAAVQNKAGEYIQASLQSISQAGEGASKELPDDLRYSLTDAPGNGAYPICATVWVVCYVQQPPEKARLLRDFLAWITHAGQDLTAAENYARLPPGIVKRVEDKIERIGK